MVNIIACCHHISKDPITNFQEFMTNFPDGVMSYNEFRDLSSKILEPTEVDAFCRNVFRMFDSNKDANLVFTFMLTVPKSQIILQIQILCSIDIKRTTFFYSSHKICLLVDLRRIHHRDVSQGHESGRKAFLALRSCLR